MSPLRILVIEDHLNSNSVLCTLLRKRGHEVTGVLSAREALQAARSSPFDLAILDLQLPDDNGWNLSVKLRLQLPNLRLIAISGHGTPADRNRSQVVGIAAHLLKPVDIHALETAIACIMPAKRMPRQARPDRTG